MSEINVILAVDKLFGIGLNGKLPWNIKDELNIFKEKTFDSIVIMGRKTIECLPKLKNRIIFGVSNKYIELMNDHYKDIRFFSSFEEAFEEAKALNKKIFVAGGSKLYNYVFEKYKPQIKVHISFINEEHECDAYFKKNNLEDFYIDKEIMFENFKHCEMTYIKNGEWQYINLIKNLLKNGERKVGRNAETISDFCKHLKFDLRDGFPLLTTKKMFLKGIIEELLFFIRGDTNSKILEEKGINIWKGNTSREFLDANGFKDRIEGEMGPMYGRIWRNFNGIPSSKDNYLDFNIDQLKNIINEIKTNPTSRRLLLTTYNPAQVRNGVLYPCHSITIQFYIQNTFLDMFCYNRSSDVGLGLPFNIASSSLFLMIIAKLTNLIPRYFNLSLGDVHIYSNHIEPIKEQIDRISYCFPNIKIPEFSTLEEVEKLTYKDFSLENYKYYHTIKMDMVA